MKKLIGFTLIELLVVIAIIGILSAIVMVNVGAVRKSSKDAAIKANMTNLLLEGEVYYNNNETYRGVCSSEDFEKIGSKLYELAPVDCPTRCIDELGSSWIYCAGLNVDKTRAWCVDSTGSQKEIDKETCLWLGETSARYFCSE